MSLWTITKITLTSLSTGALRVSTTVSCYTGIITDDLTGRTITNIVLAGLASNHTLGSCTTVTKYTDIVAWDLTIATNYSAA